MFPKFERSKEMSKYLLYGTKMIENDNTMRDFAKSIYNGVPTDGLSKEDYKDEFMDLVCEILKDDIGRTDIDYENLMYKYRAELGDLLYEIENHGCDMPLVKFFGEQTENSFNYLIKEYIDIHFDELSY